MKILTVPPARVPEKWGLVEGFLSAALQHSQGDYTVEHAQVYLAEGSWMLLVAEQDGQVHGAAAVQFFNRPTARVAFVVAMGGRFVTDENSLAGLRAACKEWGATRIECAARESTARLFRRVGFVEKYRIMETPI